MGRKRRRNEASGRQVIQALQMFQNLVVGRDAASVQRLLESREVLVALADGRLSPAKALATLGLPVRFRKAGLIMDFFGLRKDSTDEEVREAFARQGLRPATEPEFKAFAAAHAEVVHDVVIRSRLSLVLMGERVRIPGYKPAQAWPGYVVISRTKDGSLCRDAECADTRWDKTYRFLGVRLDAQPEIQVIPSVSVRHISPKVRPTA